MENKIKYFIGCSVPVYVCNFTCDYCYLSQCNNKHKKEIISFFEKPEKISEIFDPQKLGGYCYFNLCAEGETMLHPQLIELVSKLTEAGHYVDIITNGTLSNKIEELIENIDANQKEHLFIKFSFHYQELIRRKLLNQFIDNVKKVKNSKISFTVEITPNDTLVKEIDMIKKISIDEFGALPQITVARNEATSNIEILSKYSRNEYKKIWSTFNSKMFEMKMQTFNQKRCEFCYAGLWSIQLNLESGDYYQCYEGDKLGNFKKNKELKLRAIGKCREPHCFNSHAFLAFGLIPEVNIGTYLQVRDRVTNNGEHWICESMREFFSSRLEESNEQYSEKKKQRIMRVSKIKKYKYKMGVEILQCIIKIKRVMKNE